MACVPLLGAFGPVIPKLEPATASPLTLLAWSALIVTALLAIFFIDRLKRPAPRAAIAAKAPPAPVRTMGQLRR